MKRELNKGVSASPISKKKDASLTYQTIFEEKIGKISKSQFPMKSNKTEFSLKNDGPKSKEGMNEKQKITSNSLNFVQRQEVSSTENEYSAQRRSFKQKFADDINSENNKKSNTSSTEKREKRASTYLIDFANESPAMLKKSAGNQTDIKCHIEEEIRVVKKSSLQEPKRTLGSLSEGRSRQSDFINRQSVQRNSHEFSDKDSDKEKEETSALEQSFGSKFLMPIQTKAPEITISKSKSGNKKKKNVFADEKIESFNRENLFKSLDKDIIAEDLDLSSQHLRSESELQKISRSRERLNSEDSIVSSELSHSRSSKRYNDKKNSKYNSKISQNIIGENSSLVVSNIIQENNNLYENKNSPKVYYEYFQDSKTPLNKKQILTTEEKSKNNLKASHSQGNDVLASSFANKIQMPGSFKTHNNQQEQISYLNKELNQGKFNTMVGLQSNINTDDEPQRNMLTNENAELLSHKLISENIYYNPNEQKYYKREQNNTAEIHSSSNNQPKYENYSNEIDSKKHFNGKISNDHKINSSDKEIVRNSMKNLSEITESSAKNTNNKGMPLQDEKLKNMKKSNLKNPESSDIHPESKRSNQVGSDSEIIQSNNLQPKGNRTGNFSFNNNNKNHKFDPSNSYEDRPPYILGEREDSVYEKIPLSSDLFHELRTKAVKNDNQTPFKKSSQPPIHMPDLPNDSEAFKRYQNIGFSQELKEKVASRNNNITQQTSESAKVDPKSKKINPKEESLLNEKDSEINSQRSNQFSENLKTKVGSKNDIHQDSMRITDFPNLSEKSIKGEKNSKNQNEHRLSHQMDMPDSNSLRSNNKRDSLVGRNSTKYSNNSKSLKTEELHYEPSINREKITSNKTLMNNNTEDQFSEDKSYNQKSKESIRGHDKISVDITNENGHLLNHEEANDHLLNIDRQQKISNFSKSKNNNSRNEEPQRSNPQNSINKALLEEMKEKISDRENRINESKEFQNPKKSSKGFSKESHQREIVNEIKDKPAQREEQIVNNPKTASIHKGDTISSKILQTNVPKKISLMDEMREKLSEREDRIRNKGDSQMDKKISQTNVIPQNALMDEMREKLAEREERIRSKENSQMDKKVSQVIAPPQNALMDEMREKLAEREERIRSKGNSQMDKKVSQVIAPPQNALMDEMRAKLAEREKRISDRQNSQDISGNSTVKSSSINSDRSVKNVPKTSELMEEMRAKLAEREARINSKQSSSKKSEFSNVIRDSSDSKTLQAQPKTLMDEMREKLAERESRLTSGHKESDISGHSYDKKSQIDQKYLKSEYLTKNDLATEIRETSINSQINNSGKKLTTYEGQHLNIESRFSENSNPTSKQLTNERNSKVLESDHRSSNSQVKKSISKATSEMKNKTDEHNDNIHKNEEDKNKNISVQATNKAKTVTTRKEHSQNSKSFLIEFSQNQIDKSLSKSKKETVTTNQGASDLIFSNDKKLKPNNDSDNHIELQKNPNPSTQSSTSKKNSQVVGGSVAHKNNEKSSGTENNAERISKPSNSKKLSAKEESGDMITENDFEISLQENKPNHSIRSSKSDIRSFKEWTDGRKATGTPSAKDQHEDNMKDNIDNARSTLSKNKPGQSTLSNGVESKDISRHHPNKSTTSHNQTDKEHRKITQPSTSDNPFYETFVENDNHLLSNRDISANIFQNSNEFQNLNEKPHTHKKDSSLETNKKNLPVKSQTVSSNTKNLFALNPFGTEVNSPLRNSRQSSPAKVQSPPPIKLTKNISQPKIEYNIHAIRGLHTEASNLDISLYDTTQEYSLEGNKNSLNHISNIENEKVLTKFSDPKFAKLKIPAKNSEINTKKISGASIQSHKNGVQTFAKKSSPIHPKLNSEVSEKQKKMSTIQEEIEPKKISIQPRQSTVKQQSKSPSLGTPNKDIINRNDSSSKATRQTSKSPEAQKRDSKLSASPNLEVAQKVKLQIPNGHPKPVYINYKPSKSNGLNFEVFEEQSKQIKNPLFSSGMHNDKEIYNVSFQARQNSIENENNSVQLKDNKKERVKSVEKKKSLVQIVDKSKEKNTKPLNTNINSKGVTVTEVVNRKSPRKSITSNTKKEVFPSGQTSANQTSSETNEKLKIVKNSHKTDNSQKLKLPNDTSKQNFPEIKLSDRELRVNLQTSHNFEEENIESMILRAQQNSLKDNLIPRNDFKPSDGGQYENENSKSHKLAQKGKPKTIKLHAEPEYDSENDEHSPIQPIQFFRKEDVFKKLTNPETFLESHGSDQINNRKNSFGSGGIPFNLLSQKGQTQDSGRAIGRLIRPSDPAFPQINTQLTEILEPRQSFNYRDKLTAHKNTLS